MLSSESANQADRLVCPACGASGYFVQVMEHVENLVYADRNVVRQLCAVARSYACRECGREFPAAEWEQA